MRSGSFVYHQAVAAGFQCVQADGEDDGRGEGVVINEAPAVCVTMPAIEG